MVYELFVSTLASPAFTASDVLDLYLHRGSFETALADEDHEQDCCGDGDVHAVVAVTPVPVKRVHGHGVLHPAAGVNADAAASPHTDAAILEAHRAVIEVLDRRAMPDLG